MKKIYLLILVFSSIFLNAQNLQPGFSNNQSQEGEYMAGEFILLLNEDAANLIDPEKVRQEQRIIGIQDIEILSNNFNITSIDYVFKQNFKFKNKAKELGLDRYFLVKVPDNIDLNAVMRQFQDLPEVELVEYNYKVRGSTVPNDPLYNEQWGLKNTINAQQNGTGNLVGTPGSDINIEPAWDIHTGVSNPVTIAILDSGVDYNHPEFSGRMLPGYDFINDNADPMDDDVDGHGTACAGIAAAAGNNGIGLAGVNWGANILPVKVLGNKNGSYSSSKVSVANGIIFAVDQGADVISMSLGSSYPASIEENAINYAYTNDVLVFASRGNDNNTADNYPSSYTNVIAVGGLSPCDTRKTPTSCDGESWWGASYGGGPDKMDFVAPATRITTTDIIGFGGYSSNAYTSTFNGTSAACPFAAGVGALIRSYNPFLSVDEIRDIMRNTAVDINAVGYDAETGYGKINAEAALLAASIDFKFAVQNTTELQICYSDNTTSINFDFFRLPAADIEDVSLSLTGLPPELSGSFSPSLITTENSFSLDLTGINILAPGEYNFTIQGVSTSFSYDLPVALNIQESITQTVNLIFPTNNQNSVVIPFAFEWSDIINASSYQIQIATDSGFTNIIEDATTPDSEYTALNLLDVTEHYWRVRPLNSCGDGAFSTPFSFMTDYCSAGATITDFEKISNVEFNTINNPSTSTAGYEDFTSIYTALARGEAYNFTATISNGWSTDEILVWIDYNQDDDFTDSGELVFDSPDGIGPHSSTINIPNGVALGETRMRVRLHATDYTPINDTPCGLSLFGQVEDYSIIIYDDIQPIIPTNLQANSITTSSAIISWDVQIDVKYDLRYRETGTTPWVVIADLLNSNTNLTNLTEVTEYEVQVRSKNFGNVATAYSPSIFFTTEDSTSSCIVFEDFEAGLPADWSTVINNGNCDWANQSTTQLGFNFTSFAMVFDDDACGFNAIPSNVSLLSDVYDNTFADSITIGYDIAFREEGGETLTVEVWDGSTWQQIAFYDNTLSNPTIQNESGIDVSAFANSDFQVRWTYDDNGGTYGWYAGIDNFCLDFNLPPPPPPPATCTVFEDFNTGLPEGWSSVTNTGYCDWANQSTTPSGFDFQSLAMLFDDDNCGSSAPASNASLLSDIYDMSGSSILIGYDVAFRDANNGETLTVEVWDGSTWQQIAVYDNTLSNPTIQTESDIDVSIYANSDFQIRWTYDDNGGAWGWHAGIDNFCIKKIVPNEWEGNISTEWNRADNWSYGTVPTNAETAIIKDVPIQPRIESSSIAEVGSLILNSNTVLSVEGVLSVSNNISNDGEIVFKNIPLSNPGQFDEFTGTITGTGEATAERYIPAKRAFRLLSSPVTTTDFIFENWQENGSNPITPDGLGTHITGGDASLGFDQSGSNNPSMFTFSNSAQNWETLANTNATKLTVGEAYLIMVRGDRSLDLNYNGSTATQTTLRAKGDLFTGSTSPTLNSQPGNYNLIANPYQAVVDYGSVTKSDLTDFIYIWDASVTGINGHGAYVTVDVSGATTPPNPHSSDASAFIQPGMSFFVQNLSSGTIFPDISFTENDKATGADQVTVFSSFADFYINSRLYLSSDLENESTERDAIGLRFSDNFTTLGSDEDATKFINPDENFAIVNNGLRSIDKQAMPTIGHEIDISITNYTFTEYSLTFVMQNAPENLDVFLKDEYLDTQFEITEHFVYDFNVDNSIPESVAENRFSFIFENTSLSIDDNNFGENFSIYPNPTTGDFSIITPNLNGEVIVEISNILGQKVFSEELTIDSQQVNIDVDNLSVGVYIVELHQDKNTYVSKLIVK